MIASVKLKDPIEQKSDILKSLGFLFLAAPGKVLWLIVFEKSYDLNFIQIITAFLCVIIFLASFYFSVNFLEEEFL